MKYNYLKIIVLCLFLAGLATFGYLQNQSRKIAGVSIQFDKEGARFITMDSVNKLLTVKKTDTTNLLKSELNLKKMESILNQNHFIETAHAYLSVEGVVGVKIQERIPIGRVQGSPDYYIDDQGKNMPLSPFFAARVPFVSSEVTPKNQQDVFALLDFISNDKFLKTHIVEIEENDNEWLLKTRNQIPVIELGVQEDLERKFNYYKAFYIKALRDQNLSSYASVALKYSNQVVCTKI